MAEHMAHLQFAYLRKDVWRSGLCCLQGAGDLTDPCWRRPPPELPGIPEAHFRFGVPTSQFLDFSGPRGTQAEAGDNFFQPCLLSIRNAAQIILSRDVVQGLPSEAVPSPAEHRLLESNLRAGAQLLPSLTHESNAQACYVSGW